ncbi:hypothetical protein EMIT0P291_110054 [Pseudomonas sp. IT-P291]
MVLALVAFRGYLISGRRRGSAVFVRIALIFKERRVSRPFAVGPDVGTGLRWSEDKPMPNICK